MRVKRKPGSKFTEGCYSDRFLRQELTGIPKQDPPHLALCRTPSAAGSHRGRSAYRRPSGLVRRTPSHHDPAISLYGLRAVSHDFANSFPGFSWTSAAVVTTSGFEHRILSSQLLEIA